MLFLAQHDTLLFQQFGLESPLGPSVLTQSPTEAGPLAQASREFNLPDAVVVLGGLTPDHDGLSVLYIEIIFTHSLIYLSSNSV